MNNWKYNFFGGVDLDGKRLTWSGVVAGIATFLAVFLTLSLIGFSIGLTTLSPLAENPLKNVGTNVTIWTVIALIISFAAGGFVSGLVANKAGFLHGFMTWVVGVILIATLVTNTIGGIAKVSGNIVSETTSSVGKATTLVINKSGDSLDKAMDSLSDNINIDTNKLEEQLNELLRDTDVKELQPEYLKNELNNTKNDIKNSGKEILLEPENYKNELNTLFNKLEDRAKNIGESVDKETIANAVSKNTELTENEAEIAIDNIYNEYQKASTKAVELIDDAKTEIDSLGKEVEKFTDDVKEGADKAADTGAKSSLYLFIGLVVALFITGFSGIKGANFLNKQHRV